MMEIEDSARTMMKARSSWRLCEEEDDELWGLFENDEDWGAIDDSLMMTMMKVGDSSRMKAGGSLTMMNLGDPSTMMDLEDIV